MSKSDTSSDEILCNQYPPSPPLDSEPDNLPHENSQLRHPEIEPCYPLTYVPQADLPQAHSSSSIICSIVPDGRPGGRWATRSSR